MGLDDNPALKRADLSTFVFHLTKDGPDDSVDALLENRAAKLTPPARENLLSILAECEIKARGYHSLFKSDLKDADDATKAAFKVVCLSEAPLIVLDELVVPKRKGNIKLKPYGVIFTREGLIQFGGNEAFYVGSNQLKEDEWARYKAWKMASPRPSAGTLPLMNLLNQKYDFTWEKEWRFIGDFRFRSLANIRGVILPAEGEDDLLKLFHDQDVPVIRPGMTQHAIDQEMTRSGPIRSRELRDALTALLPNP
jgi:hypothetical protein